MINIDLPALVVSALEKIGCDRSLIGDLDAHSPIELSFKGTPNIYVEASPESVWLVSYIGNFSEEEVRVRAEALTMPLMQGRSWVDGAFIAMGYQGGELIIKGRVTEEALQDAEPFAEAISDFFGVVGEVATVCAQ